MSEKLKHKWRKERWKEGKAETKMGNGYNESTSNA